MMVSPGLKSHINCTFSSDEKIITLLDDYSEDELIYLGQLKTLFCEDAVKNWLHLIMLDPNWGKQPGFLAMVKLKIFLSLKSGMGFSINNSSL
jgi:hypothetical protein